MIYKLFIVLALIFTITSCKDFKRNNTVTTDYYYHTQDSILVWHDYLDKLCSLVDMSENWIDTLTKRAPQYCYLRDDGMIVTSYEIMSEEEKQYFFSIINDFDETVQCEITIPFNKILSQSFMTDKVDPNFLIEGFDRNFINWESNGETKVYDSCIDTNFSISKMIFNDVIYKINPKLELKEKDIPKTWRHFGAEKLKQGIEGKSLWYLKKIKDQDEYIEIVFSIPHRNSTYGYIQD
jgi:hypothetical protein